MHPATPRRSAALAVLALALASAGSAAPPLRVFAAASLTDAFREIAALYEASHPGEMVELSFAGSQVLRTQIEQGARADVFAAADLAHADALERAGLLSSYDVFASNALVVVVPATGSRIAGLADLGRAGLKLVVAGPTVPVGRYTAAVLEKLGRSRLYGEGFEAKLRANVVSEETNVRMVLSKVVLGEADAGFVYATDAATAAAKVGTLEIPEAFNVVAQYPIGLVRGSGSATRGRAFVDLVSGAEGQGILARFGFGAPR